MVNEAGSTAGKRSLIDATSVAVRSLIDRLFAQYGSCLSLGSNMKLTDAEREFICEEWLRQQPW